MSIKMRAKTGPQWPNQAQFYIGNDDDYYIFDVYGEQGNMDSLVMFGNVNEEELDPQDKYHMGSEIYQWHVYEWHRDLNGNWSVSVDGDLKYTYSFQEQPLVTSFNTIGIGLLRNQSAIDWVEVSTQVPEPATISLLGLGTMALIKKRRA